MSVRDMAGKTRTSSRTLAVGGLTLDLEARQVKTQRGSHRLTPKECRLLEVLMLHPGKVLTRKLLMKEVWETDFLDDTRTLDVHICWLRKKIEENPRRPRYIRTVRGTGYRFGVE